MSRLLRAYDAVIQGLVVAAGLALAVVCLLIVWDVVARNLGLAPPESTVALTEYALLYVTLAAGPALVGRRGHVMIGILHDRLPTVPRRWLDRGICLFCAALAFGVAILSLVLAVEAAARGEVDVRSLDIPREWLFRPLAVGFALMGTEFLRLLAQGQTLGHPPAEQPSL